MQIKRLPYWYHTLSTRMSQGGSFSCKKLQFIEVYENPRYIYLIGSHQISQKLYRVLVFDKLAKENDLMKLEPETFTKSQLEIYMKHVKQNLPKGGKLFFVGAYVGIAGIIRFFKGYYLVLICNGEEVGTLDQHSIITCKGNALIPLFDTGLSPSERDVTMRNSFSKSWFPFFSKTQDPIDTKEEAFLNFFNLVDMSKHFYWSYTYNLCQSLQRNMADRFRSNCSQPSISDTRFVWNTFMAKEFIRLYPGSKTANFNDNPWLVLLMHGSFHQRRCSHFGRHFTISLVARRSRYFAGTRFLKRGINEDGYAANDVEIEQIFEDHSLISSKKGGLSSYLQVRGSVPTFWSQEISVSNPKPRIQMKRFDPYYTATKKHFADLMRRYGRSIVVLNLVKLKERSFRREVIVGKNYKHAIGQLNIWLPTPLGIDYRAIDFTRLIKTEPASLVFAVDQVAEQGLNETSMFISSVNSLRDFTIDEKACESLKELARIQLQKNSVFHNKIIPMSMMFTKRPQRWSQTRNAFKPMKMNILGRDLDISVVPSNVSSRKLSRSRSTQEARRSLRRFSTQHQYIDVENLNDDGDDSSDGRGFDDDISVSGETVDEEDVEISKLSAIFGDTVKFQQTNVAGHVQDHFNKASNSEFCEGIQTGVIRTNCIDCLDRTNFAQFLIGLNALRLQLVQAEILNHEDTIEVNSTISSMLMNLYEDMGDKISIQYGGSDAVKKGGKVVTTGPNTAGKFNRAMTVFQRYYTNNFTDHAKQDGINVFLGVYRPEDYTTRLEDISSGDFYLHNKDIEKTSHVNSSLSVDDDWWTNSLAEFQALIKLPLQALSSHIIHSVNEEVSVSYDPIASSNKILLNGSNQLLEKVNDESPDSLGQSYARVQHLMKKIVKRPMNTQSADFEEFMCPLFKSGEDPHLLRYAHKSDNPFSLFEFSNDQNPDESTRKRQTEFTSALNEYKLSENDGWGMRRLQAYAGATTSLLQGSYKGLPHALPAVVILGQNLISNPTL